MAERLRTGFGTISFQKSHLKKKLPQRGQRDTVYLEEMRVIHVSGDVRKSSDDGKTWNALRMPSKGDDTAEQPIKVAPLTAGPIFPPSMR